MNFDFNTMDANFVVYIFALKERYNTSKTNKQRNKIETKQNQRETTNKTNKQTKQERHWKKSDISSKQENKGTTCVHLHDNMLSNLVTYFCSRSRAIF